MVGLPFFILWRVNQVLVGDWTFSWQLCSSEILIMSLLGYLFEILHLCAAENMFFFTLISQSKDKSDCHLVDCQLEVDKVNYPLAQDSKFRKARVSKVSSSWEQRFLFWFQLDTQLSICLARQKQPTNKLNTLLPNWNLAYTCFPALGRSLPSTDWVTELPVFLVIG